MNRLAILCALLFVVMSWADLSAQQLPLFTQYREYGSLINPAMMPATYFPYEHTASFGASYRSQWTDLPSSPQTAVLRGEFMTSDFDPVNLLVGGHIIHDETGPTGFTGAYGRIGGVLSGDPYYGGFVAALSVGAVQYRVNVSELRLRDPDDIVAMDDQSQIYPDVSIGIFGYTRITSGFLEESILFGGLSMPQALGLDLQFSDEDGEFNTKRVQHYYAQAGLMKFFDDDSFLEATAWAKYVANAPANVDVNLRYQLPFNLWLGAGYSTANTMHLETGVLIGEDVNYGSNHLRIGYGFDYSFTSFGPFVGPAHEINVSYSMGSL